MARDYKPAVGDVVIIHDPKLAEQLGHPNQLGVIIKTRRGSARLIFLPGRENYWVEDHRLYPHPAPDDHAEPLLLTVRDALLTLGPEEAQVEDADAHSCELHALCLTLNEETALALRQGLGDRLRQWKVIPYGMAAFTVILFIDLS